MSKEIYEVLEKKGTSGLTIGSHVLKPGGKFTKEAWPYSDEKLKKAIETKRCVLVKSGSFEKEKKKADDK